MYEEIEAYEKYLLNFRIVEKPIMPKFDLLAYTESEYLSTIFSISSEYDVVDDEYLTVERFKGDKCK